MCAVKWTDFTCIARQNNPIATTPVSLCPGSHCADYFDHGFKLVFLGLHIKGVIHCVPTCLTGGGCNALFPSLNIR